MFDNFVRANIQIYLRAVIFANFYIKTEILALSVIFGARDFLYVAYGTSWKCIVAKSFLLQFV